jgi:hypothetical protein
MDETKKAQTTALPLDDRPEVHESGTRAAISLEQDKRIREGNIPEDRFDDDRMKTLPGKPVPGSVEE